MSFFDGIIDPDDLKVDAPHVAGTHHGTVSNIVTKKSAKGDPFFVVSYDIGEEFDLQEWFQQPTTHSSTWDDTTVVRTTARGKKQTEKDILSLAARNFKRRLLSLGVPEDGIRSVGPEDLRGVKVIVETTLNDKGYAQVKSVTVPGASGTTLPGSSSTASASATQDAPVLSGNPFA